MKYSNIMVVYAVLYSVHLFNVKYPNATNKWSKLFYSCNKKSLIYFNILYYRIETHIFHWWSIFISNILFSHTSNVLDHLRSRKVVKNNIVFLLPFFFFVFFIHFSINLFESQSIRFSCVFWLINKAKLESHHEHKKLHVNENLQHKLVCVDSLMKQNT